MQHLADLKHRERFFVTIDVEFHELFNDLVDVASFNLSTVNGADDLHRAFEIISREFTSVDLKPAIPVADEPPVQQVLVQPPSRDDFRRRNLILLFHRVLLLRERDNLIPALDLVEDRLDLLLEHSGRLTLIQDEFERLGLKDAPPSRRKRAVFPMKFSIQDRR